MFQYSFLAKKKHSLFLDDEVECYSLVTEETITLSYINSYVIEAGVS